MEVLIYQMGKKQNEKSPYIIDRPKESRKCLMCGKEFQSIGPANRICPQCNKGDRHQKLHKVTILHKKSTGDD
jgi:Zn finger protein HypA/HybF involved in hydrogenase expression